MQKTSIITATLNAATTLRRCFTSIRQQNVLVEHIVVDGGSTDGTLGIIEKNLAHIELLISGEDNGFYDALNRGIQRATGEIVGILNADDGFASHQTLEVVSNVFVDPAVDCCYGDLVYVKPNQLVRKQLSNNHNSECCVVRYWKSGQYNPKRFYWGWMPPHPTFFVRKSVYEKFGHFNIALGTAADYELMLRFLLKNKVECRYIPEILVNMQVGGASNASLVNRLKANRYDRLAWKLNDLRPYPWTTTLKPLRKISQWLRRPNI